MSKIIISSRNLEQVIREADDLTVVVEGRTFRMGTASCGCEHQNREFQANITFDEATRLYSIVRQLKEQPITVTFGDGIYLSDVWIS